MPAYHPHHPTAYKNYVTPKFEAKHLFVNQNAGGKVGKFDLIKHAVEIAKQRFKPKRQVPFHLQPSTKKSSTIGLNMQEMKGFKRNFKNKHPEITAGEHIKLLYPAKRIVLIEKQRNPNNPLVTIMKNPRNVKISKAHDSGNYRKGATSYTQIGHFDRQKPSYLPYETETKTLTEWKAHYAQKGKHL